MKALPKGQYIKHFQYGVGVITESDEQRTSIDFDIHGMKELVTNLMVVDPAEGTPPKTPASEAQHESRSNIPSRSHRRRKMSESAIVQYVGCEAKASVREYSFLVRQPASELREFTLTIVNEAFDSHRVRYQDAPDICSLRSSTVKWPLPQTIPRKHITGSAKKSWKSIAAPTHRRQRKSPQRKAPRVIAAMTAPFRIHAG